MHHLKSQGALGLGLVLALILSVVGRLAGDLLVVPLPLAARDLGVMWIGLLYYFNFVQMIAMPKISGRAEAGDQQGDRAISLFFFRWAAAFTASVRPHRPRDQSHLGFMGIGIGMGLGLIMAFNVWFIIWPNQQKVLGLVEVDADARRKPRAWPC